MTTKNAALFTFKQCLDRAKRWREENPEEAKKWDIMMEQHKNEFKTAATYPTLHSMASGDCKLIARLVSERMEVDWVTDPRDETYIKHSKEEGFFESYLPRVKEEFKEVNDLIREATTRLLKRLIAFEKAGLSEFEELGYSVTIQKPIQLTAASDWADYDFKQNISVADKVFKGTTSFRLTWGFRDFVSMSVGNDNWTTFDSDSRPKVTFAAMILIVKDRLYNEQRDWEKFVAWRKEQMAEKGLRQANTVIAVRLRGVEGTMASKKELVLSRFEEGKPADPTKNMSPEDAKEWKQQTEEHKDEFKAASDQVLSRFEEGKPADPTKNMTPEDAKEWERMNEEHKDEFKAASTIRVATRFLTADQDKSAPSKVDDYFKKVKKDNPGYTDEQAWATAWSIYCAYKKPGDPSCHQETYFPGKKTAGQEEASRKPSKSNVGDYNQHAIMVDLVKNPNKRFLFSDPKMTAEKAEEILRDKFEYTDAEIKRLKQASADRTAGWSHAVDTMSVLFVEGRKPVPFNIDTIKEINTTFIPVVGDDGETHDANLSVIGHQTSGPLTFQQEKAGMRRETRVDIQFPVDEGGSPKASERATLTALVKLGKGFGFKVEPVQRGYRPQTRKQASELSASAWK